MREIAIHDLCKYVDPMNLEKEWAIALADDGRETNGLTIGWGQYGTLWSKPAATVYIHKSRYSKHIFDGAAYFSICYLKPEDKPTLNYFGRVSGRDEDKIAGCGKAFVTDDLAPYFADSRVAVLCRVMGRSDFDVNSVDAGVEPWYQRAGVHTLYHGEIVKVLVSDNA